MLRLILLCAVFTYCYASPSQRILNGVDVKEGEIPYIVSVRYNNIHICGGSILNKNHILTAAQCVYGKTSQPNNFSIQYGLIHMTDDNTNCIIAKSVAYHPDYESYFFHPHDVAVITLENDIIFSENAQPVKLPKMCDLFTPHEYATFSGWGSSKSGGPMKKDLQRLEAFTFTDPECDNVIWVTTNSTYHICAGDVKGGSGQCDGDAGGPLYSKEEVQIGIVSWSLKECGVRGFPGMFAKVSPHVDWIEDQILKN